MRAHTHTRTHTLYSIIYSCKRTENDTTLLKSAGIGLGLRSPFQSFGTSQRYDTKQPSTFSHRLD
ncbi:hypothetical protein BO85DRAFT_257368 [Aspergillus piperis CBS 112811]|uniref:Uncharacterized protein n=1 Tax=Aspergillus piperis CBS 112811 TaxID=1448313 RepID=A0A8G1R8Y8_9EURO|nr:hypothetical protein BO85DRAFT_257368 [Aspergillus piperis CBS 112811]RAH60045.1 hypothetical protein BO85DRAFT_257368 [Aspergillus piperis CBS 112811]